MPDLAAADTIFPELLLKYTPTAFAALVISGALAAAMSTGDSQLHASAAMISTDVYKKYINPDASEKKMYSVARGGVLVVGFISVIFALIRPGMLSDLLNLANSGVGVLVPTLSLIHIFCWSGDGWSWRNISRESGGNLTCPLPRKVLPFSRRCGASWPRSPTAPL